MTAETGLLVGCALAALFWIVFYLGWSAGFDAGKTEKESK